ncbi:MAG: DUF1778 domain-containing protein [Thermomicrobiales bacterium]|nr:DUF1778 domain-containing protein [Thermomicrobiales bacterium]
MSREPNADPLTPAESLADWEAQGWATEPEPIVAASRLEATISIRFDPESARVLRQAARLRGVPRDEFIRQAALEIARATLEGTSPSE